MVIKLKDIPNPIDPKYIMRGMPAPKVYRIKTERIFPFYAPWSTFSLTSEPKPNNYNLSAIGIDKIIFNAPATIVMWTDGTKTVVKLHDEEYNPEKAVLYAFWEKNLGVSKTYAHKMLDICIKQDKGDNK